MTGNNECCGTCKFHRTNDNGEWVCTNDMSEYYALETGYSDVCVDWDVNTGRGYETSIRTASLLKNRSG